MNSYVPAAYDERIFRLALGVDPRDAQTGLRVHDGIDVTFNEHPAPLHVWRRWAPGELLDDVLPRMRRHESGRFKRLYEGDTLTQLRLRISDHRRRYVPRRFAITISTETDVVDAELDAAIPEVGISQRILRPALHPAAAAGPASGTTALRGRVTLAGLPVRWTRARATLASSGALLGWAHGDDRGEFLLPIGNAEALIAPLDDPVIVNLSVGYRDPAPAADPAEPLQEQVDPLWDLIEETVTLPPLVPPAGAEDGRRFPPGYSIHTVTTPIAMSIGRSRSIEVAIP